VQVSGAGALGIVGAGTITATSGDAFASFFPAFSSADLLGDLNDETGAGLAVFATSPEFTTDIDLAAPDAANNVRLQVNATTQMQFEGSVADAAETLLQVANCTDTGGDCIVTVADADSSTIQADTGAANNFLTAVSATGVISKAQPDFSNLSGTVADAQIAASAVDGGSGGEIEDGTIDGEDMNANYAGSGLEEVAGSPDSLAVDLIDADDQTGSSSNQSGLEFGGTGGTDLGLLRACGNGQVLKFNTTGGLWECQPDNDSGGSPTLDSVTAAAGTATINSGDNAIVWNWSLTTADKTAFQFGENVASTATGNPDLVSIATLAASTAHPLQVTSRGTANGIRVGATDGVLDALGTGGVDWAALLNYPTGCTNQFVTDIADTLTCATVEPADMNLASTYAFSATANTFVGTTFTSGAANPADAGFLRIANNQNINWRDAGNAANISLRVNASDQLEFVVGGTSEFIINSAAGSQAAIRWNDTTNQWTAGNSTGDAWFLSDVGIGNRMLFPSGVDMAESGLVMAGNNEVIFAAELATPGADMTWSLNTSDVWLTNAPLEVGTGYQITGNSTAGRFLTHNGTRYVESDGAASGVGTCTNQFAQVLNDDAAPTCASVDDADITADTIQPSSVTAALDDKSFSIDVINPTTTESAMMQHKLPVAITCQAVTCSTDTGTATIDMDHRVETTPNTAGTDILTGTIVCDTDMQEDAGFADATIPANRPIVLLITATSGTPGVVRVHAECTVDDV
jgi:hypothetical protein